MEISIPVSVRFFRFSPFNFLSPPIYCCFFFPKTCPFFLKINQYSHLSWTTARSWHPCLCPAKVRVLMISALFYLMYGPWLCEYTDTPICMQLYPAPTFEVSLCNGTRSQIPHPHRGAFCSLCHQLIAQNLFVCPIFLIYPSQYPTPTYNLAVWPTKVFFFSFPFQELRCLALREFFCFIFVPSDPLSLI